VEESTFNHITVHEDESKKKFRELDKSGIDRKYQEFLESTLIEFRVWN
jgi:hypothetical protein